MHRIWAVAENTFKEALRQRILALLIVFSILLIVLGLFLEPFAIGESPKIIRDFGLAILTIFGVLVVIIVGSTLIYKDIEKRTLYTVITRPIKRSEIILGKFIGLSLLIALLLCAMAIIHQVVIFIYEGVFDIPLLLAVPFALLEIMLLLGILMLFSSYSSPALTAFFGIIFFVVGHASPDLKLFAEQINAPFIKCLAYGFYYLIPNLENFNLRLELVHRLPIYADQILFSACYGIIYIIFLLYLAIMIFERREFK
jgi:ABC-type transport system involved in multi-copper enzyme maturation permease subunit